MFIAGHGLFDEHSQTYAERTDSEGFVGDDGLKPSGHGQASGAARTDELVVESDHRQQSERTD